MPGVLFHSCHPSFRHTGVMFPDFASLTRSGDLWDPLDSSLRIRLLQQGPTLPFPFAYHLSLSLGSASPRVIFILAPPGQCFSKCWSKPSDVRRPLRNQGLWQPDVWLIRCALRPRYVQLLSGFVGTIGRLCWTCFIAVEMSCSPGFRE